MFTFSFGSAFATVSWTGEATSKTLNEAKDYDLRGETVDGGLELAVLIDLMVQKVSQKLTEQSLSLLQKQN